ncbi:hypothetical protein ABOM_000536 [Aspergillus bombycis]|uniref:Cupin type-2 domain-containing protein n=1 Tax=Aspergillus bombycis TaxID=109264 RepID=A0A1F8AGD7_9EURO|nr:hypothetical protein ABOM_000536 [Aspergillus bombycis]OGM50806.1 hypothetical protein ABOM_000536 [Aspergillus bombycis]
MATREFQYDPKIHRPPKLTQIFHHPLDNCPGKCIIGLVAELGPGTALPPHRHGGATVSGYILEGTIYNKMNDEPQETITKGGQWFERPGCHHRVSANASDTEPAKFFATFVIDEEAVKQGRLMEIDEGYQHVECTVEQSPGMRGECKCKT